MKKVLLLLMSLFLVVVTASAQGKSVSGVVVDAADHEPLIAATVSVKGQAGQGVLTDMDGKFTIKNIKAGAILVVSYVGYTTKEVAVADRAELTIELASAEKQLETVVVTALGIKRSQKALSYNVQEVKNDALTTVKDANFMNSLNGKVAGVNIQRSASGVGGATRVVMRGNKSISGDNNVLYVIDGVPVGNSADRGGDGSGFGSGRASGEGISSINPDDIESISVLTGPSAAALYGASAANGVILINTKKGAAGKLRVNFSSAVETASPFMLPKFQNTYGNAAGQYTSWGDKLATPSNYKVRDFYNRGVTFNNSFNFSVGTDKNQTYFSASAINAKGIVPNNKYHRYNASVRNTSKFLDDKLTLDVSASYVRDYANNMISYGAYFNPIVGAYLYPRGQNFDQEKYFERYDAQQGFYVQQWSPGSMGMDVQNPYWVAYRNLHPETNDRYMLFGSLKYELNKKINFTGRVRLDNTYTERETKLYASTSSVFSKPLGYYSADNNYFKQKYVDFMANYNSALSENFNLTATLGTSYEEYDNKGQGFGGHLFLIPNKFIFANTNPLQSGGSQSSSRKSNFAVFGSAELAWRNAVYLTLTGRTDKPSQLVGSVDPWIFYPSIGLSAVVTDLLSPEVRAKLRPALSFLKVRTSYTEVGSPIPFTGLTPGTITHSIRSGKVEPFDYYPLPDLKAERTRSFELGIDSRWFDGALTFGATIYQSNTLNQLLETDLDPGTGYKKLYVQAGNVRNRGIEMTLGFNKKFGPVDYSTSVTATANRNKIIKLASGVKNPITGEVFDLTDIAKGRFRLREGGELGDVYASERIKRDANGYIEYTPGQSLVTEPTEPYKLGSVNAKWNLGWKHGVSFKGFDLNVLFTARLGGIVISKTQAALDKFGVSQASADARDAGGVNIGQGLTIAPQQYYDAVYNLDSYYVYSATNVRLQELSLSYSLPKSILGKTFKNVGVSLYATNLWMIYNKAPYDPELTGSTGTFGQGYDYFMLPSQRTIGASIKLGI
ncbi:SusC/RagA family TonB-linked outer membrane protein [uncultured Porphyromonas sp.]|uniref:SusC/RagA family TonB-linked outer membrane protein n=1 Tax=uncultured Porphyromonas sp. TaxID=159274 RepID=UPI0026044BFE|nr:SusC/RagA family TonB-linked outer membrane protein [uncultured Porphyromonas sp.]